MQKAFIGFGGNLGDVAETFDAAVADLLSDGRSTFVSSSSLYRSPPWGGVAQPDYLNAAVQIETAHAPHALLALMLAVEQKHGRDRMGGIRWGPRTLDLDLLLYGDRQIDEAGLELPHPRLLQRAFVVMPLLELAPGLQLPDGTALRDAASAHTGAIMEVLDRRIQPERHDETDATT